MKMRREKGKAMNHQLQFMGRSLNPVFNPGVYWRRAANAVSKNRPKFNMWFLKGECGFINRYARITCHISHGHSFHSYAEVGGE